MRSDKEFRQLDKLRRQPVRLCRYSNQTPRHLVYVKYKGHSKSDARFIHTATNIDKRRQSRGIRIASSDNVNRASSCNSVRICMMFSSIMLSDGLPLHVSSSRREIPSQNYFVDLLTIDLLQRCSPYVSLSIHTIPVTFPPLTAKTDFRVACTHSHATPLHQTT